MFRVQRDFFCSHPFPLFFNFCVPKGGFLYPPVFPPVAKTNWKNSIRTIIVYPLHFTFHLNLFVISKVFHPLLEEQFTRYLREISVGIYR